MSCSKKFHLKKGHKDKKDQECSSCAYQSPISLLPCDITKINQRVCIKGENVKAIYNYESKIFEVQDTIILKVNHKRYQLDEYHFHIPGEHKVNEQIYPSEIHYVFVELEPGVKHRKSDHKCSDVCGGTMSEVGNILVIGRLINNKHECNDLTSIQVRLPNSYYVYDGSLTTGAFSPVRWLLGDKPIHFNLEHVESYAKGARPLQPLDGRIILYQHK